MSDKDENDESDEEESEDDEKGEVQEIVNKNKLKDVEKIQETIEVEETVNRRMRIMMRLTRRRPEMTGQRSWNRPRAGMRGINPSPKKDLV